jgi:hypothetical protein
MQVGIVALNLIGEPLHPAPEGPPPYLDVDGPVSHELQYYNRAAAEVADLQLDVHVDSSTAARIKVRGASRLLYCSTRSISGVALQQPKSSCRHCRVALKQRLGCAARIAHGQLHSSTQGEAARSVL